VNAVASFNSSPLLNEIDSASVIDQAYQQVMQKHHRPTDAAQVKDGRLYYKHRLYIPNDRTLKTRILHECHDTALAEHLGRDKTIEQVKRRFYWPKMDDDIEAYVISCDACQRNKPSHRV